MSADTVAQLQTLIAKEILKKPNRVIQPDEALLSSGLVDSMHAVDLALLVEDHFGVRIEDFEITRDNFDTIEELAAFIAARQ